MPAEQGRSSVLFTLDDNSTSDFFESSVMNLCLIVVLQREEKSSRLEKMTKKVYAHGSTKFEGLDNVAAMGSIIIEKEVVC